MVLVGDGGEEDDHGGGFAVVLLAQGLVHPLAELGPVVAGVVVPGLVGPEEGEDDVGLGNLQVGMRVDEAAVAGSVVDLVAAESVVAEGQLPVGHGELGVGLEPAVVLHALGEGVA